MKFDETENDADELRLERVIAAFRALPIPAYAEPERTIPLRRWRLAGLAAAAAVVAMLTWSALTWRQVDSLHSTPETNHEALAADPRQQNLPVHELPEQELVEHVQSEVGLIERGPIVCVKHDESRAVLAMTVQLQQMQTGLNELTDRAALLDAQRHLEQLVVLWLQGFGSGKPRFE